MEVVTDSFYCQKRRAKQVCQFYVFGRLYNIDPSQILLGVTDTISFDCEG